MDPSSSPLHASFLESSRLRDNRNLNTENDHLPSPSFPVSGAGSPSLGAHHGTRSLSNGRRTRLLHLRNAGFRGPNLPARRVTPTNTSSTATTTTWSAGQTADIENMSPLGRKKTHEDDDDDETKNDCGMTDRRNSGYGVLQDIVNSSAVRRARPRVNSAKFWTNADASDASNLPAAGDNNNVNTAHLSSPPQPAASTTKSRSLRAKAKLNRGRRSASREAREYIDYLEGALSSAIAQIDAISSSNAAQEQSDKLRHMNAENQNLQKEVNDLQKNFEQRVGDATADSKKREADLREQVRSLEAQLKDAQQGLQSTAAGSQHSNNSNNMTANVEQWRKEKVEAVERQLKIVTDELRRVKARNAELEHQNEEGHAVLAHSPTPSNAAFTPGLHGRSRPPSWMPSHGSLAMSPMSPQAHSGMPFSPGLQQFSGVPSSPLASNYSPEVMSPNDGNDSDASVRTSIVHQPPDTFSRRSRLGRRLQGNEPKELLLVKASLDTHPAPSSAPAFGSFEDQETFRFPAANEPTDGSPHAHRRRTSTKSATAAASRNASGLTPLDTSRTMHDMDMLSKMKSPDFASFNDGNIRNFSSGTMGSNVGKSYGRNLMDELSAVRTFSTSTGNEHGHSELSQDEAMPEDGVQPPITRSSPFDYDVKELPETGEVNIGGRDTMKMDTGSITAESQTFTSNAIANDPSTSTTSANLSAAATDTTTTNGIIVQAAPATPVLIPSSPPTAMSPISLDCTPGTIVQHLAYNRAKNKSAGAASQMSFTSNGAASRASLSTLDSLRTAFSNLFRTPLDVVKHLVQAAQAHMSIPRSPFSFPWWLVEALLPPILYRAIFGRSSRSSAGEQQPLLQASAPQDNDANGLAYGAAYQTPQSSPSIARSGSSSMVAGTGKKRASSASIKNAAVLAGLGDGEAVKNWVSHSRGWKHSPYLWWKFGTCLAMAIAMALKHGPEKLLREAQSLKKGKKGNWRGAARAEAVTPP